MLGKKLPGVGVTHDELAAAGLTEGQWYNELFGKTGKTVVSLWELADLAAKPRFHTAGDASMREPPSDDDEPSASGSATADDAEPEGSSSASAATIAAAPAPHGARPRPRVALQTSVVCEQLRAPALSLEGVWARGLCGGLNSTYNPQIQMETAQRTWCRLELAARHIPYLHLLEIKVLHRSRWGLRRPKVAHVFASARSKPFSRPKDPAAQSQTLRLEFELPAGEVVTLVLACGPDIGDDDLDEAMEVEEAKVEAAASRTETGEQVGAAARTPSASRAPSKVSVVSSRIMSDSEVHAEPSWTLTFVTSAPMARGPLLLRQRHGPPHLEEAQRQASKEREEAQRRASKEARQPSGGRRAAPEGEGLQEAPDLLEPPERPETPGAGAGHRKDSKRSGASQQTPAAGSATEPAATSSHPGSRLHSARRASRPSTSGSRRASQGPSRARLESLRSAPEPEPSPFEAMIERRIMEVSHRVSWGARLTANSEITGVLAKGRHSTPMALMRQTSPWGRKGRR